MGKYRKHIRLKGFDYSSEFYYFVTICTDFRKNVFDQFVSGKYNVGTEKVRSYVVAPSYGAKMTELFNKNLTKLENLYSNIEIDFYCLMPNHCHLIVVLTDKKAAYDAATTNTRATNNNTSNIALSHKCANLPSFVTALKSCTTREAKIINPKLKTLWQPNYYEHIIRSEQSLDCIRNYILTNPRVSRYQ